MLIIGHRDITELKISPEKIYQWVCETIKNKDQTILPPKCCLRPDAHRFFTTMPSIITYENCMGVKIITRQPDNEVGPSLSSQILLYDLDSGKLLAIMDGSYITAMRTGAIAAHTVSIFARPDFSNIGLVGLGVTGTATMDMLATIFKDRELTVHLLRHKNQEASFIERYKRYQNIHFVCHNLVPEMFQKCEVIISCVTYIDKDFASTDVYQEGCLVVPVHSWGFMGCDTVFDKVFVDDIGHTKHFKNFNEFKSVCEVSEVVRGIKPGRENKKERILVYNVGVSIHDIYFAKQIFKIISATRNVELDAPLIKNWLINL